MIKRPVEKELNEFRALFEASLTSSNPRLQDVLSYIKKRRGKMMRPILVMLMAKLFGKLNDATFHAALSLELLHTASLVHDDVVDESDERRGQSSVNAIYNNKVSVLVGDYMLATSLKHASHTGMIRIVELVACLGQDLSEGEILPRAAFRKMLDMGEQLVDLFPGLCESHKRMVAQFLAEAYDAGDERVTRDLVVKLNKITKAATKDAGGEDDAGRRGMFAPLIEKMNAQDAKA